MDAVDGGEATRTTRGRRGYSGAVDSAGGRQSADEEEDGVGAAAAVDEGRRERQLATKMKMMMAVMTEDGTGL